MKRLKGLIKIELYPALGLALYFMLVNVVAFSAYQLSLQDMWNNYLSEGIRVVTDLDVYNNYIFVTIVVAFAYCMGFCFWAIWSFGKDKNHESARFLKALPYTATERCYVKIGISLVSYFIGFIVYALGLFVLRVRMLHQFQDAFEVTMMGELHRRFFTVAFIAKVLVAFFVFSMAFYFLMIMFQYLMSHNVGSMISGILIFLAPGFLVFSSENYYENRLARNFLEKMYFGPHGTLELISNGQYISMYDYVSNITSYVIFWSIICILAIIVIMKVSKEGHLGIEDAFIRSKIFRGIYKVGFGLCGGVLVGDLYRLFITDFRESALYILTVIGFVVSTIIGNKIAQIGIVKRKKEV